MRVLTTLAATVVAFGLTLQQLAGAALFILGLLFVASLVVQQGQVRGGGIIFSRQDLSARMRASVGAVLILAGIVVALLPPEGPGPVSGSPEQPTFTGTTASSTGVVVSPTAPTATTAANVVYLMTLRPSGALPQKGVATINGTNYQKSMWYDPSQADFPNSTITSTWSLGGKYHQFEAWIGMMDGSSYGGPTSFQVWLDGTRVALQSMSPAQDAYDLQVDLKGAQQLTLTMVLNNTLYDTPVWGNAQLT